MSSIKGRNRTFIAISVLLLSFLLILMGNNDVAHAQEGTQELLLPEESVESVVESEATEQTVSDQGVEVELDTEESSGVMDDPLSEETEEVLLGDNLEADSESLEMSEEVMPMFQQSSSFSTFSATAEDVEPEPTSSESAPTPQPASPKAKLEVITGEDGNLYIRDNETNEIRKDNAWVNINGKWYFPNAQGNLYRNRIITFGPSVAYYMNADGSRETNTRPVSYDGKHYIVGDGDGRAYTNRWVDYDGHHYFPNGNGLLYRNQYITFGRDIAHYMDNEGRAVKGFQEIDGNLKYFDRAGAPEDSNNRRSRGYLRKDNAWIEIDNKRYFPNSQGNLYRNQRITFGPDRAHYMGNEGYAVSGVQGNNGILYYYENDLANKHPERKTVGWIEHNNNRYFARDGGQLYTNRTITFGPKVTYYVGADGSIQKNKIVEYGKNLYLLTNDGQANRSNSWVKFDGKWYFPNANGVLYRNQRLTFGPGKAHYVGNDGYPVSGVYRSGGKLYYYQNKPEARNPQQTTEGWINYNGNRYFARPGGQLYQNEVITFGADEAYYMNNNGVAEKYEAGSWEFGNRFKYRNGTLYVYNSNGTLSQSRKVGKDHVLISLSNQYMWLFRNGKLNRSMPVVTGKLEWPTPTGNFYAKNKLRNVTLTGPTWAIPVNYWIEYHGNGAYGLHDAGWQPASHFYMNSTAYRYGGSHGCINIREYEMPAVYNNIYVGMPITIVK